MEHPSGLTKKKLHAVYLKALGLPHQEIERIARTSADNVTRYLKAYHEGGLASLGVSRNHRPVSSLQPYHDQIKSPFLKQPPHTVSEASHEIEVLTGIKLGPSACRDFMRKRLGMKFRKMAVRTPPLCGGVLTSNNVFNRIAVMPNAWTAAYKLRTRQGTTVPNVLI